MSNYRKKEEPGRKVEKCRNMRKNRLTNFEQFPKQKREKTRILWKFDKMTNFKSEKKAGGIQKVIKRKQNENNGRKRVGRRIFVLTAAGNYAMITHASSGKTRDACAYANKRTMRFWNREEIIEYAGFAQLVHPPQRACTAQPPEAALGAGRSVYANKRTLRFWNREEIIEYAGLAQLVERLIRNHEVSSCS